MGASLFRESTPSPARLPGEPPSPRTSVSQPTPWQNRRPQPRSLTRSSPFRSPSRLKNRKSLASAQPLTATRPSPSGSACCCLSSSPWPLLPSCLPVLTRVVAAASEHDHDIRSTTYDERQT